MRIKKSTIFLAVLLCFVLEYSTYFVVSVSADRLIKVGCFALLALFFKKHRPSAKQGILLFLYACLFGSAILGSLLQADFVGLAQCYKYALLFSILPLVLLTLPVGDKPPERLVKLVLPAACVFCVMAVILFFIIYFDLPYEPTIVVRERLGNMEAPTYGLLGSGPILYYASGQLLRAETWFVEPSKFAGFLLYPTLIAFGYYRSTGKLSSLGQAVLCLLGLAMTFSMAGYFGLIAGIVFALAYGDAPILSRIPIPRSIKPPVIVALVLGTLYLSLGQSHTLFDGSNTHGTALATTLGRDPTTQTLLRRESNLPEAVNLLANNPWGVGLGMTAEDTGLTSPNALIFWIMAGGIPAVLCLLGLYGRLFYSHCLPLLESNIPHYRAVGAAFVAATVQQLSYGTWLDSWYLLIVAVMVLCSEHLDSARAAAGVRAASAPARAAALG